jgi:hypothetical protein
MTFGKIGTCLGEREAARRLGISRITLLRARHRGEVSHFRLGARVVYSELHLVEYLASKERKSSPRNS